MGVLKLIGIAVLESTLALLIWPLCARAYARDGAVGLRRNFVISHIVAFPAVLLTAAGFWSCTVYIAGAQAAIELVRSNANLIVPTVVAGWLNLAALLGLMKGGRSRRRCSFRIDPLATHEKMGE